jgi:hypothetical protein
MHPVTVTAKKSPIIRVNTFSTVRFLLLFIILPLYKKLRQFLFTLDTPRWLRKLCTCKAILTTPVSIIIHDYIKKSRKKRLIQHKSLSLRDNTLEIMRIIAIIRYYQQYCTFIWMGWEHSHDLWRKGRKIHEEPSVVLLESVGYNVRSYLVRRTARSGACGERSNVQPGRRGRAARVH